MKLLVFVVLLLPCIALAQNEEKAAKDADQSWSKTVYDKLRINYFSEYLGPNLARINDEQPDVDAKGNYADTPEPAQLWNQVSFNWKLNDTWSLIINPRFTLQLGSTIDLPSDDGLFRTEDFLVGAQGTIWKNGPWSIWARPGYRLPTSRGTRDANWNGQVEWLHILDWTSPETKWNFGAWNMYRFYVPTEESTNERWRIYFAPYVTYTLNSKWRLEAFYENEIQHNEEIGAKNYNYAVRTLQSAMTGVTYTISPSLSVFPFLRYYTVRKFDAETIGFGAWIIARLF
jgi:hypothetical protein